MKLDYYEVLVPNETPYKSYQEHINRYAFASDFVKDKVVLDIACGTGYGSDYLRKKEGRMIVGGDLSKNYLDYATSHYRHGKELVFVCLDALNLPFHDGSFDVLISLETIEHLKYPSRFLSECKRVLRMGGKFICSTPNKQIFSPYRKVSVPVHVHEFYIDEFCDLLKEYFVEVKLYAQRYVNLPHRVARSLIHVGSELVNTVPGGHGIKNVARKLLPYLFHADTIARLGVEIRDEILDRRHAVIPYWKSFWSVPGCITAVARKRI